jgi:hypothetical protein
MKKLLITASILIALSSCGSGDTGEGYEADRTGLNPNAGQIQDNTPAGDRGNPDSTIGATTNTKNPDTNATNRNIRD